MIQKPHLKSLALMAVFVATQQDPVAYRMRLFGDKNPRHRAALQLAVGKSGYRKKQLHTARGWGVAVHESFSSALAYVFEASEKDGSPVLHHVTSGVNCNMAVNPRSVEAQVQGVAITFKEGALEQSNFGEYIVARLTDAPYSMCTAAWANLSCHRWRRRLPTPSRCSPASLCMSCRLSLPDRKGA